MPTRAAPPLGGFLERHRATEFVIDASTLEILNVLRIGYPAHYPGGGFCASGAVCCSLLHVRSHNIRSEGSPPQGEPLRTWPTRAKRRAAPKGGNSAAKRHCKGWIPLRPRSGRAYAVESGMPTTSLYLAFPVSGASRSLLEPVLWS
jgi:hypothetical protein